MQRFNVPSIDKCNPLYRPDMSATAYVDSLRKQLRRHSKSRKPLSHDERLIHSFARILDQALQEENDEEDEEETLLEPYHPGREPSSPSDSSGSKIQSYTVPNWETDECSRFAHSLGVSSVYPPTPAPAPAPSLKRKRSGIATALEGPDDYNRSIESFHDSSFDVTVNREKLRYLDPVYQSSPYLLNQRVPPLDTNAAPSSFDMFTSRIQALEDELYGPPIGTESPRGILPLIHKIDRLFPGIRILERLSNLDDLSHQGIADMLAKNGLLNYRVLEILRTSEIRSLSLTPTLLHENGLNIAGADVLPVFRKPNSFLFLSELSFSGTPLSDIDIAYIHHLPHLATLFLENTGIGNEAVFHLTVLKRSLTQLSIAANLNIDDDAVPALILLTKLSFFSILDTSITMVGLRRLADVINRENREVDIEIPTACEKYIDNLSSKYLVNPQPPLILKPDICDLLSAAALKRNLTAHAASNPSIVAAGTKPEMIERLRNILQMRQKDLLVKEMVCG